ncbi:MAG: hypothetical protein HQL19_07145 [Candidatus Omnitrophica bacterium]|nr:hypothetical protein [Candidatus Omnitrophota bacterium]
MDKEEKVYALLAYLFLLCVIPLVQKKDSAFVLFHARQGLAIFFCEFAVFMLTIICPFLFKPAILFFGVFSLWGMLKAVQGETFELPFFFALSKKIAL